MGESTWTWSKTAASNASADSSINWAEGQAPGSVNNSARSMMAALAKARDDQGGALTLAGGTTAYTLTTNQGLGTLADGTRIHAVVNATNTGAATLAVDGLAAKAIRKYGAAADLAIAAGELPKNYHAILQYDASANSAAGAWVLINPPQLPAPGIVWGLVLSNNSGDAANDIDIGAGSCADDTNTVTIALASSITKRLDAAWAAGTNQGGLDTGTIANDVYHVWLIQRSDTGIVDALFSASATSPTMPASFDRKRRVGAIIRSAGSILAFTQIGDDFLLTTPVVDHSAISVSTTGALYALTVPDGIKVEAKIVVRSERAASTFAVIMVSDPDVADTVPTGGWSNVGSSTPTTGTWTFQGELRKHTNTAAQVRARAASASTTVYIATFGWRDRRGKDA